jgi:hypothetical protein
LLKRAHPEPAQRADRNQRRRGQQHRDSARLYPGQAGSILRLIVHHPVTVVSRTRHEGRGAAEDIRAIKAKMRTPAGLAPFATVS